MKTILQLAAAIFGAWFIVIGAAFLGYEFYAAMILGR